MLTVKAKAVSHSAVR